MDTLPADRMATGLTDVSQLTLTELKKQPMTLAERQRLYPASGANPRACTFNSSI